MFLLQNIDDGLGKKRHNRTTIEDLRYIKLNPRARVRFRGIKQNYVFTSPRGSLPFLLCYSPNPRSQVEFQNIESGLSFVICTSILPKPTPGPF